MTNASVASSAPTTAPAPAPATQLAKASKPAKAAKPAAPPATKPAQKADAKKVPAAKKSVVPKLPKAVPPAPAKATKDAKAKKQKLVRDSFTIPKDEYAVIELLKQRAAVLAQPVKKSELLRAGLKALAGLSDSALRSALQAVPSIKTGRPKAEVTATAATPSEKTRTKLRK